MPAEWKRTKPNEILETDDACTILQKQFNQCIVADKYPYFFIYNYLSLKQEFDRYFKTMNYICYDELSVFLSDLISKYKNHEFLSPVEQNFLNNYFKNCPVSYAPSIMNRLCWQLEQKLGKTKKDNKEFDYALLLSENKINKRIKKEVEAIYDEYKRRSVECQVRLQRHQITKDEYTAFYTLTLDWFKQQIFSICNNAETVTDALIDLCYTHSNSKQFVWDVCGEQIIRNLLNKHNNLISYPVQDREGEIEFWGEKFSMRTINYDNYMGMSEEEKNG